MREQKAKGIKEQKLMIEYGWMALTEILKNSRRIVRLARYELSSKNRETFLGAIWNILNPALQILVFWFIFSVGLKLTSADGRYPYAVWLTCGILPWMAINQAVTGGAAAFYSNASVLKNIRLPLTVIPVKAVVSAGINHFWTLVALLPFIFLSGVIPSRETWMLLYYVFSWFALLSGLSLADSAISVVFPDFQKFLPPLMRLLFYISSVVWPIEKLPVFIQYILKLNPFTYLIQGYRDCLLYHEGFIFHTGRTFVFWITTVAIWLVGSRLHYRFRDYFIDVL